MTLKQQQFSKEYVNNGGNATKAALEVYDADYDNAKTIASRNLDKPAVIEEINKILAKKGLNSDSYIASKIEQSLEASIGVQGKNSDAVKLLDMLLKVNNSYPMKRTLKESRSYKVSVLSKDYSTVKAELKTLQTTTTKLIADLES